MEIGRGRLGIVDLGRGVRVHNHVRKENEGEVGQKRKNVNGSAASFARRDKGSLCTFTLAFWHMKMNSSAVYNKLQLSQLTS